jgi:hypothetical protein
MWRGDTGDDSVPTIAGRAARELRDDRQVS